MAYRELKITDQTAVAAAGNSGVVPTSASSRDVSSGVVLYLDVTAAAGGTTMDITVNGFVGGKAYPMATFTQVTATGLQKLNVPCAPKDVRLDWTVGGASPSFDFTVHAHRCEINVTA